MTSAYSLPGWKLRRITFLPRSVVVWLCAFLACWPLALCLHYLSRVGDQARVERTLHDLDRLADAVSKGYLTRRAEGKAGANEKVSISVRQLTRTGIAPAAFFTPAGTDQPLGIFNAWGGPILNSVDQAGIRLDLEYVPRRICVSLVERAHSLTGVVRLTTDGTNDLRPPVERSVARAACTRRSALQILFASPASRIAP